MFKKYICELDDSFNLSMVRILHSNLQKEKPQYLYETRMEGDFVCQRKTAWNIRYI